jgi:hypothetical protein
MVTVTLLDFELAEVEMDCWERTSDAMTLS